MLRWDVSEVENHEVVTTDPNDDTQWHPTTMYLIYSCGAIGMREITKTNAVEFHARLRARELLLEMGLGANIEWAEVRSHIGLSTNHSECSSAVFWKPLRKRHEKNNEGWTSEDHDHSLDGGVAGKGHHRIAVTAQDKGRDILDGNIPLCGKEES